MTLYEVFKCRGMSDTQAREMLEEMRSECGRVKTPKKFWPKRV